jgi:hypothetical protein
MSWPPTSVFMEEPAVAIPVPAVFTESRMVEATSTRVMGLGFTLGSR